MKHCQTSEVSLSSGEAKQLQADVQVHLSGLWRIVLVSVAFVCFLLSSGFRGFCEILFLPGVVCNYSPADVHECAAQTDNMSPSH